MGRMASHILWKIKKMFETTNQIWFNWQKWGYWQHGIAIESGWGWGCLRMFEVGKLLGNILLNVEMFGVASSETYPCNPMYGYPSSCFAARSSRCFLQCLQHRQPCHSSASNMNPMQVTHLQGLHVAPKPWWNNHSKMPVERDGNSKALGLSTRFCST